MIDPITFAVIKSGLDTIVDDMAYAVMRTARSPIVRDVLDYSVTICDARGCILSQAKTVALHLGAVPDAMDVVLSRFAGDLFEGDVIVLNDPYDGGMHLPDIFMFKPIFSHLPPKEEADATAASEGALQGDGPPTPAFGRTSAPKGEVKQ
jgi:N-methylhydantoinase B